jgi:DNA-directed RNA polymerase specialized sigma subunit
VVETVHATQQRLQEREVELEETKAANTQLKEELRQREALIQELMGQKSELLNDKDRLLLELGKLHGKTQQAIAKEGAEASSSS